MQENTIHLLSLLPAAMQAIANMVDKLSVMPDFVFTDINIPMLTR